jgi:hypothetical protein
MDTALDIALTRLVTDDVLTAEQALAVTAAVDSAEQPPRRALSAAAEALAYAGAAIAGSAALALASTWWGLLRAPAQAGVLLLASLGLFAAGRWVDGDDAAGPVRRLVAFCWFFATAAATGAVGVVADSWLLRSEDVVTLAVGATALAVGGLLVRRRPSSLLLVPVFLGLHATVFGLVELLLAPGSWELWGLLAWSVSAAFGLLVWAAVVVPVRAGYVLASVGALVGAQVLSFELDGVGLALGLATSIGLLAALRLGARTVAGFGVAGLVVFVPQALAEVFPGAVVAPVVLFTLGLAVLGAALAQVRSRGVGA